MAGNARVRLPAPASGGAGRVRHPRPPRRGLRPGHDRRARLRAPPAGTAGRLDGALADAYYDAFDFLEAVTGTGASFLLRSTRKRRPTVRRPLPDGSYLTTICAGKYRSGRAPPHRAPTPLAGDSPAMSPPTRPAEAEKAMKVRQPVERASRPVAAQSSLAWRRLSSPRRRACPTTAAARWAAARGRVDGSPPRRPRPRRRRAHRRPPVHRTPHPVGRPHRRLRPASDPLPVYRGRGTHRPRPLVPPVPPGPVP